MRSKKIPPRRRSKPKPAQKTKQSWWSRIKGFAKSGWGMLLWFVSFLTLLLTFFKFWPSVEVGPGETYIKSMPLEGYFYIQNNSLFPIYNVDFDVAIVEAKAKDNTHIEQVFTRTGIRDIYKVGSGRRNIFQQTGLTANPHAIVEVKFIFFWKYEYLWKNYYDWAGFQTAYTEDGEHVWLEYGPSPEEIEALDVPFEIAPEIFREEGLK